jgi:hypothetical protein
MFRTTVHCFHLSFQATATSFLFNRKGGVWNSGMQTPKMAGAFRGKVTLVCRAASRGSYHGPCILIKSLHWKVEVLAMITDPLTTPKEQYRDIVERISLPDSPVGIDAQYTHAIIITYLRQISERLANIELRLTNMQHTDR